jgi:hypothetical protein
MPLPMSEKRYQEIRAAVERHHATAKAAKIAEETDWNAQPRFTSVDDFMAYLEAQSQPETRRVRSPRKRR